MSRVRRWSLVVLSASVLGLAGCSSSSASSSTTATTKAPAPTPIINIPVADRSAPGTAGKAPSITVLPPAPATQLESADLIVGTGATAESGDNVTVQYVLATLSSKREVQSSWTSKPFTFTLGKGQVIPGWDKGVVGMKVGGRRELIIPPTLGYGDQSPGAGIAANDTLIFLVDLLKIN